jgi:peptide/nickel transport system substrate-binding protein
MASITRRTALKAAAATMPVALWGFGAGAATPRDTAVIAKQIDDIITLDPGEVYELSGIEIVTNIYDRLLRYEAEDLTKMVGGVAASWTVSADGRAFAFKIRPGLKFMSGAPITAEDCAFSLQRVVILDKPSAFLVTQLGWTKDNVREMVKATDAATLNFATTVDFAPSMVLNLMTAVIASVIEKKVALANEKAGDMGNGWLKTNSAGSGAFRLASWKPNESVTLEANPGFRMGAPAMKRVVVRHIPEPSSQRLLIEKADADIARNLTPDQIKSIAGNKDVRIDEFKGANTWYMNMNQGYEPLANPKVREAIKHLVDYHGMVNSFLKGRFFVQQSFLPIGFFGAIPYNPFKLDVAKAKALLAEAGYPNGFPLTLNAANSSPFSDIAQSVQQTLGQAGIKVSILPGELKQVIGEFRARRHQMLLLSWGPDYFDPHTNADTFARNTDNSEGAATKPLAWRNRWDIPEISRMTAAAAKELDAKKREAMYGTLQKKVTDEGPFVFMFQDATLLASRSNVRGFNPGITEDLNFYRTIRKT